MGSTTSSAESNLSDSDNDSCELNDVKLLANLSPFVAERRENVDHAIFKKCGRAKYDHQSITLGNEHVQVRPAVSSTKTSNARCKKSSLFPQDIHPEHRAQNTSSRKDMHPAAFKSGRLLPEYPELRDSYDQFCTTLSEHSSHEELDVKCSVNELDMLNDGIARAGPRGYNSKCCRHDDRDILDGGVLLCKRRKKTILEEPLDGYEKYQRWSMPEFTMLWCQTDDSDTESTITDQTDRTEHHFLSDHRQLTEATNKPITKCQNLNGPTCHDNTSPQHGVNSSSTNAKDEPQIAAEKDIGLVVMNESVSCPAIICTESPASLSASDYDSSGFCESRICSVSPRGRVQANTGSENDHYAYWREPRFENDVVYVKDSKELNGELLETNPSVCEVSVCASDSGYSGLSNGTGGSPECDEGPDADDETALGDKNMDILCKPELFETLKHLQEMLGSQCDSDENIGISRENHQDDLQSYSNRTEKICSTSPKFHLLAFPDVIIEKRRLSEVKKDERCAQLIEEFKFNKTSLNPRTTRNSLYRTYDI